MLAVGSVKQLAQINEKFSIGRMSFNHLPQKSRELLSRPQSLLLGIDLACQVESFFVMLLAQQLSKKGIHIIEPCGTFDVQRPQDWRGFFGTVGLE